MKTNRYLPFLIVLILFVYKEEELSEWFSLKKKPDKPANQTL